MPLEQARELVNRITAYRQENAGLTVQQAIDALGLDLTDSNYYSYAQRVREADNGAPVVTQEFPLAIIPERKVTKPIPVRSPFPKRLTVDENKDLAAQLLDVAVKLLKR